MVAATMSGQKLLIVSRDLLLAADRVADAALVYRQLATLNRRGFSLLLTAPEPDHWVPTRGSVDNALQSQAGLRDRIQQAGGDLDGVYYVPRSLLTQDRNRMGALQDMLLRYGLGPSLRLPLRAASPSSFQLRSRPEPEGGEGCEVGISNSVVSVLPVTSSSVTGWGPEATPLGRLRRWVKAPQEPPPGTRPGPRRDHNPHRRAAAQALDRPLARLRSLLRLRASRGSLPGRCGPPCGPQRVAA